MPRLGPSQSSAVNYVRYDQHHRRLYMTFRDSGEMYVYLDVPPQEYDALLAADSKGRFINARIKPRYKFQHLKHA